MNTRILLAGAAIAAAVAATSANANTLYSQAFDGTGNAYSSQNDTNGLGGFATVYDDFQLGSSATITSVGFTGEYFNPPQPGPVTKFTLTIYGDNGGQPGSAVYTTSVNGNANETSLGSFNGYPVESYSIATNFHAVGGAKYWMSVVPDLGFPPQWGWSSATGGDGVAYQDFFGGRSQLASDMAFTLDGSASAAPEPAGWAMMILGLGLAGASLRRRAVSAAA